MKKNFIAIQAVDKEHYGMFEVLSTISVMLLILAVVLYIFTRRHRHEEVRAPLEDDGTVKSPSHHNDSKNFDTEIDSKKKNKMRKIKIYTVLMVLLIVGCAQKKENREDFKDEHDKDFLRNKIGNSAVPHSEKAEVIDDSATVSRNVEESPTNYKKHNKPNTSVGGAR